jgi:hypothetical protein
MNLVAAIAGAKDSSVESFLLRRPEETAPEPTIEATEMYLDQLFGLAK